MLKCVAGALAALALSSAPAWADFATEWFILKPDVVTEQKRNAPAGEFFYSRLASREGLARLKDAYEVAPGSKDTGQLPPGTLLYESHAGKEVYYCSAHGIRRETNGEMLGGALVFGLTFGLHSTAPRQAAQQCFRDVDADGFFDEVGSGVWSAEPLSGEVAISIQDTNRLNNAVPYETVDPATAEPPLQIGLSVRVRDASRGSFDIEPCARTQKGEFSLDETFCFAKERMRVDANRLPAKIDFLDGTLLITGLQKNGEGWSVAYEFEKPINVTAISIRNRAGARSGEDRLLIYLPPTGEK